jgi:hypothetical protein
MGIKMYFILSSLLFLRLYGPGNYGIKYAVSITIL